MFFSNQSSVGVDIAERSIEVAELREENKKMIVSGVGRAVLPVGVLERGVIKNAPALKSAFEAACKGALPHLIVPSRVVLASPETQTFIHIVRLLVSKAKELSHVLGEEVAKSIPLDPKDTVFTYSMLSEEDVLIAATQKSLLEEREAFFHSMNIEVEAFDLEPQAVFRSVYAKEPASPILFCDWGATATIVSIFTQGNIIHSHAILSGGDHLTSRLAKELAVSESEAERQKISIGFLEPESKTFQIIRDHTDAIMRELMATITYMKEKKSIDISEIIFSGGTSRMPGLLEYVTRHLSYPVRIGQPFFQVDSANTANESALYLEAIGLALRPWFKKGIHFEPTKASKGWFSR